MNRLFHDQPIPDELRGAIIALGNFDGFHRGAHERRPVIVATFDPHPVRHFRPDTPPFRLTTLDQRERLFGQAGADAMLVFRFGAELASTTAEDFVAELLARHLGASGVVTGEDFTFGKSRGGNVQLLREIGAHHGIEAEAVEAVLLDGKRISSGRVREALQAGDPGNATRLLTRPFAIEGAVIHGNKRGRDFGWPTANMQLGPYLRPAYGVYAVRVRLPDGSEHDGVANLGHRPMFEPEELLEVHLFDFDGDLYGQRIEVALHHYQRSEAKFGSIDELVTQIGRDAEEARARLSLSLRG